MFSNLKYSSCEKLDGLQRLALISRSRELDLNEADPFIDDRLLQVGFKVSPSQPKTMADGNCFIHAVIDQLR